MILGHRMWGLRIQYVYNQQEKERDGAPPHWVSKGEKVNPMPESTISPSQGL
jgi:hypothetical protein